MQSYWSGPRGYKRNRMQKKSWGLRHSRGNYSPDPFPNTDRTGIRLHNRVTLSLLWRLHLTAVQMQPVGAAGVRFPDVDFASVSVSLGVLFNSRAL